MFKKVGVFPIRSHYYEPLFDDKQLIHSLTDVRDLPGIDFRANEQLDLLKVLDHATELIALDLARPDITDNEFNINNGTFESGDAEFLYQFLRYFKPRTVVEIGSGNSTRMARIALERNAVETGVDARHTCIEPYEIPWLEQLPGIRVRRERVETAAIDWSSELGAGDLLFVDSSHMIRPQGDVLKEYLEIFPRLQSGVYVHIHDIFTPRDYPKSWVVDDVKFWNEQYLLEMLLSNTGRYKVVAALNFLQHSNHEALARVCPYLTPGSEPGSLYFQVV
jgi:hypothetical protein